MCGISGIVTTGGRPATRHEVALMCAALVHRGPDDGGIGVYDDAVLGMRRLSIIDVASGRQPITNEDGTVHVVFNGEIYNYRELRRELEGRGHRFRTASDTETIVHLYEEQGADCVTKLRGMFAFALWDERARRLLLARDRLGIKPLFYAELPGRFAFASELKAMLQVEGMERRVSPKALGHLASHMTTPADESIVEGVRKLPPGHVLRLELGRSPELHRYWDVRFEPERERSEDDLREELEEVLHDSVATHMVSDVPIGAFLSGGIDSSAVVGAMARASAGPVKTFSIGFTEAKFNELDKARLVAERFGTEHHELVLEPDVFSILEDLTWHLDEPFGDSSAIPTYMVSKLAAEHVKVVLSGDGGDELFAGYDKYRVERKERRSRFVPGPLRRLAGAIAERAPEGTKGRNFLRHMALDGWDRYLDASALFREEEKRRLFHPDVYERMSSRSAFETQEACLARGNGHWLSQAQYLDLHGYLPLDILTKVDRMSMAHSLEARVPLLDHRLVELAARIPPEMKLRGHESKYLLKRAVEPMLPPEILNQPKQGFAVPLGKWFRGRLAPVVRDLLLSDTSRRRGILNLEYVERLLDMHARGRRLDLNIWTLASFELWCRKFLDGAPGSQEAEDPGTLAPVAVSASTRGAS